VAVDLYHVLAGVGSGSGHINSQNLVYWLLGVGLDHVPVSQAIGPKSWSRE
jgi:hypothetical protein